MDGLQDSGFAFPKLYTTATISGMMNWESGDRFFDQIWSNNKIKKPVATRNS
jgi:hypothetical protein